MPELEKVDEQHGLVRLERTLAVQTSMRGIPPMSGPEEGWPPSPKGLSTFRVHPLQEFPARFTLERRNRLLTVATSEPQVRDVLGERFDHISMQELDPGKDQAQGSSDRRTRLFFFSHSRRATVEVVMQGETVERAVLRRGFQPPESEDEIRRAIGLARSDPRLQNKVMSLTGEAILTQANPDTDSAADNRILYVGFYREEGKAPSHAARVDLTEMQVLSVRHFEHP